MSTLPGTRPVGLLWRRTVPAALATETGAVVAALAGVLPGLVAAAAMLVLLSVLARVWSAPGPLLRGLLVVSGPPLRFALLALAAWRIWIAPGGGPLPALAVVALLGLVLPLTAVAGASYLTRRFPWWSGTVGGAPEEMNR